jgi:hypothetical protein
MRLPTTLPSLIGLPVAALAVLGMAACSPPADKEKAPATPPAAAVPVEPTVAADPNILTSAGLGALRIGMTKAEVEAAAGPDSQPDAVGGPDPEACDMFHPARSPEGVMVMLEKGVLTSIWLKRASPLKTADGFGLGDAVADLRAKYGARAAFTPHKYVDAPAGYLTTWAGVEQPSETYVQDPAARGLVYEIGQDGKVASIAAGGPSIQYVEGCL